jgi:hypothetical protein
VGITFSKGRQLIQIAVKQGDAEEMLQYQLIFIEKAESRDSAERQLAQAFYDEAYSSIQTTMRVTTQSPSGDVMPRTLT